jgi:hypothetical protein
MTGRTALTCLLSTYFLATSCVGQIQIPPSPLDSTIVFDATKTKFPVTATSTSENSFSDDAIIATGQSVVANPVQVTDDVLKISLEGKSHECYATGDLAVINIVYQNMTSDELLITDFDTLSATPLMFSHGQLIPILTSTDNKRLIFSDDLSAGHVINPYSPKVKKIAPGNSVKIAANYYIPDGAGEFIGGDLFTKLPSGRYLLKIVYFVANVDKGWQGTISTNQIEICVLS